MVKGGIYYGSDVIQSLIESWVSAARDGFYGDRIQPERPWRRTETPQVRVTATDVYFYNH